MLIQIQQLVVCLKPFAIAIQKKNRISVTIFFLNLRQADCPDLKPGTGALASSRDTAFGTMITFTCPVGQEFATGKNKIQTVCMKGGNWSIEYIPKCQEVYCGPVPQIDNGFSIGSSNVTYRGIAMYQCYAGFTFPSNSPIEKISCLADGRWERQPVRTFFHILSTLLFL